ncbi:uncharacterized protein SCODWIG_02220 [Saccharomycodes ludwigii]|uniref:Proteasome assembly chaperone 2 n=1 Tax=Saccharomycodes ludwigii TaxID=36035 RepID=A0A376B7A5_9ASCO|nr:hypothetical protein SCDLUD_000413 [Saccharomycodes ludwigii]KAH3902821.1 hypothetical protein SCDLUD_000413 [Saccharomycodes ludwigii]SSD60459.1 uncharacterized protein SCODWIG_02220 [Saccharomycodes ludwigii]
MSTLIIPLVSTGNVPQLTVDLLLHNEHTNYKYVKDLNAQFLHPFLGPLDKLSGEQGISKLYTNDDASTSSKINVKQFSTPIELYYSKKENTYIIQQRTPIVPTYENNFINSAILPLLKEYKNEIKKIIVLDSIGPYEMQVADNNNDSDNSIYIEDKIFSSRVSIGEKNDSNSIEDIDKKYLALSLLSSPSDTAIKSNNIDKLLLNFTSRKENFQLGLDRTRFAFKLIYHILHFNIHLDLSYFDMFVYEGDNSQDAAYLVEILYTYNYKNMVSENSANRIKKLTIKDLSPPISWKGLYGFGEVPDSMEQGLYI